MAYSYNESSIPNLGHLKQVIERAHGDIQTLAALIIGTLEDMIIQEDITIATSAWVTNADAATRAAGYGYKAEVNVTGLIENANVNVTLTVPSLIVAQLAEVCPTFSVSTGKITLFAKAVPSSSIAGKLDAIQFDDAEEEGE